MTTRLWILTIALLGIASLSACQNDRTSLGPSSQETSEISLAGFTATFTVTNTGDVGPGTLRQALLDANANAGHDLIAFDVPGSGPHTIQPQSELPFITDPVTIDGYTQPGASPNTNGPRQGTNAVLKIELNGDGGGGRLLVDATGTVIRGLVINGATGAVSFRNGGSSIVAGCFFGTDPTGTVRIGVRGRTIFTGSTGNVIGGPDPADRNLISGVNGEAVFLLGNDNVLQNNIIGLDASGTTVLGNDGGVIVGSRDGIPNVVGGPSFDLGNVISGNGGMLGAGGGAGVTVVRSEGVSVIGNLIGTDVTGTVPLLVQRRGVQVLDSSDIHVGNTTGGGNVIMALDDTQPAADAAVRTGQKAIATHIEGNLIGVDITGEEVLGPSPLIGIQTGANGKNIIRGNTIAGFKTAILLGGKGGNILHGNRIGTNAAGDHVLGARVGIHDVGPKNHIGGSAPGEGNIIGGIVFQAVALQTSGSTVEGNFIGVDATGTIPMPNGSGVRTGGNDNVIGGSDPGAGNIIAHSRGRGVLVDNGQAVSNTISSNSIHSNGRMGIRILAGGNNGQEFPDIVNAITGGGVTTVRGVLGSAPSSAYRLEFFSNTVPDPSGFGEGETFLGAIAVTTDATGSTEFFAVFQAAVPVGHFATATATGPDGSTSEFSAAVEFASATPSETIETMVELLEDLRDAGELRNGPANGMSALLEQAIDQLDRGNESAAIRQLEAFVRLVERSVAKGDLSAEDGELLTSLTEAALQRISG